MELLRGLKLIGGLVSLVVAFVIVARIKISIFYSEPDSVWSFAFFLGHIGLVAAFAVAGIWLLFRGLKDT